MLAGSCSALPQPLPFPSHLLLGLWRPLQLIFSLLYTLKKRDVIKRGCARVDGANQSRRSHHLEKTTGNAACRGCGRHYHQPGRNNKGSDGAT